MNIGFWSCIILVIPFLIIGVLFAIFKEKTAKFVSGFNSFSKEEQALYDKAHIARDIRISALSVIKGRGTKSLSALNEQSMFF